MGTYTTGSASVGEFQTQFTITDDTIETATLTDLLPADGNQVLIAIRTSGTDPLTTATGAENSMDIDVVIDRIQNALREIGYK